MRRGLAVAALCAGVLVPGVGTWLRWPWWIGAIALFAFGGYALLEWYERFAVDPKRVALVATLSAAAAVGRTVVQGIPGVQPATFIVILSGYAFGPVIGAAVGAFTAVGSDFFLGEGGWTPWHVLAWGLAGWTAGLLRRQVPTYRRWVLVPFGFIWGYIFGWIMNTWSLLGGIALSWHAFVLLCVASFWFDTLHAAATAVLLWVAGKAIFAVFERFRRRLQSAVGE